jgi:DNA polymerase V
MQQAVATYVARAAVKVRKQGSVAGHLQVWLETSHFNQSAKHFPARGIRLETSTASTPELLAAARPLVEKMFREGIDYRKAGCLLTDLRPAASAQLTLFDDKAARQKTAALMDAVDKINQLHGRGAVRFGAEGTTESDWQARFNQLSPQYTTSWADLPHARTG